MGNRSWLGWWGWYMQTRSPPQRSRSNLDWYMWYGASFLQRYFKFNVNTPRSRCWQWRRTFSVVDMEGNVQSGKYIALSNCVSISSLNIFIMIFERLPFPNISVSFGIFKAFSQQCHLNIASSKFIGCRCLVRYCILNTISSLLLHIKHIFRQISPSLCYKPLPGSCWPS